LKKEPTRIMCWGPLVLQVILTSFSRKGDMV
jgi:hypothetical protein